MPCYKELEREARITLQTMIKQMHFIKKLPYNEMALYKGSVGQAVFIKKLPEILIDFMKQNNWLKVNQDIYKHTKLGQDWLSEFIYFIDLNEQSAMKQEVQKPALMNDIKIQTNLDDLSIIALQQADAEYAPIFKLYNRQRNIAHKYLNENHVRAGQKLFEQFAHANLQPSITMNWEKLSSAPQAHYTGGKDCGFSEKTYIARRELYQSLESIGAEFAAILVEVCLFGHGLEATEKAMKWPARSGKLLLTMALDRLAEHYQLLPNNKPSNKYLAWISHDMITANAQHSGR